MATRTAKAKPAPIDWTLRLPDMPITLVGHPYAPIGMGELMRSHIAAFRAIGLHVEVFDIFKYSTRHDSDHKAAIALAETSNLGKGLRIFFVNGDEIDNVLARLEALDQNFDGGINVILPAWELPRYPEEWVSGLARFDEIWALSRFVSDSLLQAGLHAPVIGTSLEVPIRAFLPRRHFGIRESAFALLNSFDLSSYAARKNPEAVLSLLRKLRAKHPFGDFQLILKVKNAAWSAEDWLKEFAHEHKDVLFLSDPLTTFEMHSLINACDCSVSLHRAEGFGRSTGEAMFLGRLACATGWSGNLDYMNDENSLLVRYDTIAVPDGAYVHAENQFWAEPDPDHAFSLIEKAYLNPDYASCIAKAGQQHVRLTHSHRAIGQRILERMPGLFAKHQEIFG